MRLLVAWCLSPRLAHLLLLEHNYRWNLRQSINNRGLGEAVGGFYYQPMLEAIERVTSKLYGNAKYPDWLPTSAYADTGERCGFVRSIFASNGGGGGIAPMEEILGGEDNCGLEPPSGGEVPCPCIVRDTMRPVRLQEGPVRNHLRLPDDVGGAATAVAQPWVLQPPDGFEFPTQLPALPAAGEQGGSSAGAAAAGSGDQGASAGSGAVTGAP
ncbi:unnamed protein product, partial [Pylaiella littoralis]